MTASGIVPSTMVGRIRWLTADLNAPSSVEKSASHSMKPVTCGMSYSTAMRPDTGVQPSFAEKNMMRIKPHQKIGIE